MISIIIPFFNEADSLPLLYKRLTSVLGKLKTNFEIIFVDDGSTDGSLKNLKMVSPQVKIITHRKRLGKGQSLADGFKQSTGGTVVFMDADLQDDPADINKFLDKIRRGLQFVNGWRMKRQDPVSKTLPSSIFNLIIIKLFFKAKFHDINCGFKAMKREVLEQIPLYADNYRFLPLLAEGKGFRTGEVVVTHHKRRYGKSKFGFLRLMYGLLDTVTAYFIDKFSEKPLHFFGPIGSILFVSGFLVTIDLVFERIFYQRMLYRRPALLLGILFIIVGIQVIMTGIIGVLIVYLDKKAKLI